MKAVIVHGSRVVLLKNDRGEWELPGGRLEDGEDLEECVRREVLEETGLSVEVGLPLGARVFEVVEERRVLVVAYGCFVRSLGGLRRSEEHQEIGVFEVGAGELDGISLPGVYRESIGRWIRGWLRSDTVSSRGYNRERDGA